MHMNTQQLRAKEKTDESLALPLALALALVLLTPDHQWRLVTDTQSPWDAPTWYPRPHT